MEHIDYAGSRSWNGSSYFSASLNKLTLVLFDFLAFALAASFAQILSSQELFFWQYSDLRWQVSSYYVVALGAMVWFWGNQRHYSHRKPFWDELKEIFSTLAVATMLALCINAIFVKNYSLNLWSMQWATVFVALPVFRNLSKALLNKLGVWAMPCVIIGDAQNAKDALNAINSEPSTGFDVQAIVLPSDESKAKPINGIPTLSKSEFLARSNEFYKVFIALEKHENCLRDSWIRQLSKIGLLNISVVPALRGIPLYGTDISNFFSHEVMMLRIKNNLNRRSSRMVKRLFDIVASAVLLLLLSPVFAYIGWKVSRDGGSATYGHERVGLNGKKFKCLKFRSMVMNSKEVLENLLATNHEARAEWEKEFKLKNDPRITPIGQLLRKTSLDELPQLWNVFKGEMSLVGPRPVIDEELLRYGEDVLYYNLAKPGMSGLWQVSGRSDTDYDTRVYLDSWYVKNWSLWYDIVILFKTVGVVLKREGAY